MGTGGHMEIMQKCRHTLQGMVESRLGGDKEREERVKVALLAAIDNIELGLQELAGKVQVETTTRARNSGGQRRALRDLTSNQEKKEGE